MKTFVAFVGLVLSVSAMGQPANPYAGQQTREIKALSQVEIEGYLDGKGMGQAKAAELNAYPGPKHVLDLADALELTAEQRRRTRAIFERMHEEAVRLGERIVERERDLDRAFADGDVDKQRLESTLAELGKLKGRLRYTHLAAHLDQRTLLTEGQIEAYQELRGYGGQGEAHDHVHGH